MGYFREPITRTAALGEFQTQSTNPRPSCWAPVREWAPWARTIPVPAACLGAPFTVETALFTKLILTCWVLDLVTKSLCVHLIMFSYLFIFWDGHLDLRLMLKVQADPSFPSGPVFLCDPCLLRHKAGLLTSWETAPWPLLGSRTPPQMGKGQHSQWRSTGGNKLFCVWKMPNQIWGIWKNHKNTPRPWILFLLYNKKYRRFNRP